MITIRIIEFWITEPMDDVLFKIKLHTKLVKFGLFNAFDTDHENFRKKWIGDINTKTRTFKLFRVTGKSHTSDLSVNGEFTLRLNKPVIIVKFKVHFTALLGLLGVLVFGFAAWYLPRKKGIILDETILIAILLLVGFIYSYFIIRDLNKSVKEIERLIYTVLPKKEELFNQKEEEELE